MRSTRRLLRALSGARARLSPLSLAVGALALAAWAHPAAAQVRVPVTILEYDASECQQALSRGGARGGSWCIRGVATHRAGIAEVLVEGNRAVLRADSTGATTFTGFARRDSSTQVVGITIRTVDGITSQERFRVTAKLGADPNHPEREGFAVSNLQPRVLGVGSDNAQVAYAPPAAPAPGMAPPPVPGQAAAPAGDSTVRVAAAATEDATNQYIRILEPQAWAGVGTRGITVPGRRSVRVVGYASHPNGVIGVDIDGHPAALTQERGGSWRFVGFVPADSGSREVAVIVRGQTGVPVIGRYTLNATPVAQAFRDKAQAWTAAAGFSGKRWALVVGISAYQDTSIRSLRYADADARAFYDFLRSPGAGAGGFAEDHVKLLLNEQATYSEVRAALFTFLRQSTPDDEVIIYFAGHGAPDPLRQSDLYLLTYDTRGSAVASTGLPMRDMQRAVEELYARHIVLITDACHSGGMSSGLAMRGADLNQINRAFVNQLNSTTGGLAVFNASEADQSSAEDARWGGGHGVFTYYLLQALKGGADEDGDHIVTLVELMQWTMDRVRRETQNAQIPSIGDRTYDRYLPMSVVLDSTELAAVVPLPAAPGASAPTGSADAPAGARVAVPAALADSLAKARDAVGTFPNSALYRSNLGRVLMRTGATQEAIAAFREAVRMDPLNPEFQFDLATALRDAGLLNEAPTAFEAAIAGDATSARYFAGYGVALLMAGKNEQAVDRLRRAVRIEPTSAVFQAALGRALRAAGHPREAAAALRLAVGIDGAEVSYRRELAFALSDDGRAPEAVAALQEAVQVAPDSASLSFALGGLLRAGGNLPAARTAFAAAVQADSSNTGYRSALGAVLRDLGLNYEALLEYRAAVRLAPGDAAAHFALGELFGKSNRGDSAVVHLQRAVELEPANARYHNGAGLALQQAGHPAEALAELIQAVRAEPTTAKYQFDLGSMYVETGNLTDAVAALQQAARLDSGNRDYAAALRAAQRKVQH